MTQSPTLTPRSIPKHPSRRAVRVALCILVGTTLGFAAAFGPADALLRGEGPRVHEAHDRVWLAEDALYAAQSGVSTEFSAVPSIAYGADVEDPAVWEASIALQLDVGYSYDFAAILQARIDLEKALVARQDAHRWEGKEALELYGAWLRAQLALDRASTDVAGARDGLVRARQAGDAHDVAYAELELRDAELAAADERAVIANLARDAAGMGLLGQPVFEPALFALPVVAAQDTPAYRILALARIRADALVDREHVYGVVRSVELAGRYESKTDGYQLDAVVGLDGGRPSVGAGVEYRPQQDDQWTVGLTASIGFGDSLQRALGTAERRAAEAGADLESYVEGFPSAAAEALRLAEAAHARLEIARQRWGVRTQELADARARGADTTRLERNAARDLDRMYLAWLRYVEEVDDHLALVGADWQIVDVLD